MERAGVIEPSQSPWSSPIVIAKKKDGRPRFCIDFRKVNEASHKDAYPLPQVEATLDKLRGAHYLSTIEGRVLASTSRRRKLPRHRIHRPGKGTNAIPRHTFRASFRAGDVPAPPRYRTRPRTRTSRVRIPRRHHYCQCWKTICATSQRYSNDSAGQNYG